MQRTSWFWGALASCLAVIALWPAGAGAEVTGQQVHEAVEQAVTYFRAQQEPDGALGPNGGLDPAWALMGLAGAGVNAADLTTGLGKPSAQEYYLGLWTGPEDTAWTSTKTPQASDYERVVMLAKAAGLEPLRLSASQNMLAKLAGFYNEGYFGPKGTFNQTMFALIALDQLPVPSWLVEQVAQIIEANAHEDGGYTYSTVESQTAYKRKGEVDLTGAAIAGLCGAGRTAQSPAVKKAIAFLESTAAEGKLGDVDSISWALDGLGACGVKRGSSGWTSADERAVEELLKEQLTEGADAGAFKYGASANYYATQDALRALDAPGFDVEPPPRVNPSEPTRWTPPTVTAGTPVPVVIAINSGLGDIHLCSTTAPADATLPEALAAAQAQSSPAGCVGELEANVSGLVRFDGARAGVGGDWKVSFDGGSEQDAADQRVGFGEVIGLRLAVTAQQGSEPGRVFAWGENEHGQLGLETSTGPQQCTGETGTKACAPAPTPVPGVWTATGLAAGESHSLILQADGTVLAAGAGADGELGDGATSASTRFTQVPGISTATQVAAGRNFSLALLKGGEVLAWGENEKGQLGSGTVTATGAQGKVSGPETCGAVACSTKPIAVPGIHTAVQIAAGQRFGLALLQDGEVLAWGEGIEGELGDGSSASPSPTPQPVTLTGFSSKVVQIAAGSTFALALLQDGEAIAWGASEECGRLGNEETETVALTPVKVKLKSAAVQISASNLGSLATLANGQVVGWGCNYLDELGVAGAGEYSDVPVELTGPSGVAEVAANFTRSFALTSSGDVWAWGDGEYGLGFEDGDTGSRAAPAQIELSGVTALAQGEGGHQTLAIVPATPTVAPTAVDFGAQAQETIGQAHTITVTAGSEPLHIDRLKIAGANASDFIVVDDECTGETLQPGGECAFAVRFAPSGAGSRSASLIVYTEAATNPEVQMSGEGGGLPTGEPGQKGEKGESGQKGEKGEQGQKGEKGEPGQKGEKGEPGQKGEKGEPGQEGEKGEKGEVGEPGQQGEPGPQGSQGAQGQQGAQGASGPAGERGETGPQGARGEPGPAGRNATVTCRLAKGARKIVCSVALKGKQAARTARARLTRGGRTFASGGLSDLRPTRRLRRGVYTLHVDIDGAAVAIRVRLG